ncbi:hypothetical protein [Escherichia phage vB_EcoM_JNE01]|nr:hypothetical protein [Escherichia phage vB_EcoM_JNE01]
MQHKLSEDQSDVFLHHMFIIDKFFEGLNAEATAIIKKWYKAYKRNKKWYWLNRDMDSFIRKITYKDTIELKRSSMGYSYLSKTHEESWNIGVKVSVVVDMTGLPQSVIQEETEKLWKIVEFMHDNISFVYKNFDAFTDIKAYNRSPYVLSDKLYHHMELCKAYVKEWNLEE